MQSVYLSLEQVSVKQENTSNQSETMAIPTIADLNLKTTVDRPQSYLSTKICQYLTEDPDNFLKDIYIQNNLEANFQAIALAKLSGESWQEIAVKFNLEIETLSDFFQNCCAYYAEIFTRQLENK
jgi:hypothetical protein